MKKPYIDRDLSSFFEKLVASAPDKVAQILKDYLSSQGLTEEEILFVIKEKLSTTVPLSIFSNKAPTLEILVSYLSTTLHLRNCEIASLLSRSEKTIWAALQRSHQRNLHFEISEKTLPIPLSLFKDRTRSSLCVLVVHLRDTHSMKFTDIAHALCLSPKTVWTVYSRATKTKKP